MALFKLNPSPQDPGIVRMPDGKFASSVPKTPHQIHLESANGPQDLGEVAQSPTAAIPQKSKVIPWPDLPPKSYFKPNP
jgi:hypothetical protein